MNKLLEYAIRSGALKAGEVVNLLKQHMFPWPELLVFVRHAQSVSNFEHELLANGKIMAYTKAVLAQRDMDVPLTELGQIQASQTKKWLIHNCLPFDAYFSSPYLRARQTGTGLVPDDIFRIDPRLREKDFGVLEQKTNREIREEYPNLVDAKNKIHKYYFRAPGGENYPDLMLRAHSFLTTLRRDWSGKRVLVFSHSAMITCFRALLEHHDEKTLIRLQKEQPITNASLTIYKETKIRGKSRLQLVTPPFSPNEASHNWHTLKL